MQSSSIWLSSLSLANDTREGKLLAEAVSTAALARGASDQQVASLRLLLETYSELAEGLAFCLSRNGDLLSQWRGYADNGSGVSIGFSVRQLGTLAKSTGSGFHPVDYDPESHARVVEPILDQLAEPLAAGALEPMLGSGAATLLGDEAASEYREKQRRANESLRDAIMPTVRYLYELKSPAFREEEEVRLISLLSRGADFVPNYRAVGSKLVAFRVLSLRDVEEPCIREVVLGPRHPTPEHVVKSFLETHEIDAGVRRSGAGYR